MTNRYKTILLFGAPGSGKGTQGKILGTIPGFFHSSTGDIFRSLDHQSVSGRSILDSISKGKIDVLKIIHLVADQAKMVERLRRRALRENRVDDASDEVIARRFEVYQK